MTQPRRLSHPPIQEAIVDFHLSAPTKPDADALAQIAELIAKPGWSTKMLNRFHAAVGIDPANTAEMSLKTAGSLEGYVVQDPEGRVIVQVRRDRVTVSHTKAYTRWEDLIADGIESLRRHVEVSRAPKLKRIGSRYINRIKLPSDDFTAFGELLEGVPTKIGNFQSGTMTDFVLDEVVKGITDGWFAKIKIGTALPLPGEKGNCLIVDVDVVKDVDMSPDLEVGDENLVAARQLKNDIFFGAVTERALEAYR
jgi:uncharacterized protein (TIGR04255 family)